MTGDNDSREHISGWEGVGLAEQSELSKAAQYLLSCAGGHRAEAARHQLICAAERDRPCLIPQAARASEMSHPAYTIVAMTYGYDLDEREVLRITVNCNLNRRKNRWRRTTTGNSRGS